MLPTIVQTINVEMIRDGGSYAATFSNEFGGRYILFTRIKHMDIDETTRERIGYEPPILIDCDPTKRPPDTDKRIYGELSGPATAVTWAEARNLMVRAKELAEGQLDEVRRKWLDQMTYVMNSDGAQPPDIDAIVEFKRPPSLVHKS